METVKEILKAVRDIGELYIWLAVLGAESAFLIKRSPFYRTADLFEKVLTAVSAALFCAGAAFWIKDFTLSDRITGFPGVYLVKLVLVLAIAGAVTVLLLLAGKKGFWKAIRTESGCRWAAVVIFVVAVLLTSWQSDDAYHSFIMAKHLVEGKGFVYNVGYRVTASTCPLFTLLIAAVYLVVRHMAAASLLVSGGCCAGLACIVFFRFCKTRRQIFWAEAAMLACYSFMCYTTSGLENALLYLLGALFLLLFLGKNDYTPGQLLWMALLVALIAWTRMDAVLLFVPMACYAYLAKTHVRFIKRVGIGLLGLSPFFAWEIFSVFYYGYPFPNTMYIKLNTGIPKREYIVQGLDFLYRTFTCDLFTLLIPLAFLVLAIYKHNKDALWLGAGVVLYTLYVISIGGDFMLGRHLTMQFILSLCGLLWLLGQQDDTAANARAQKFYSALLPGICLVCLFWGTAVAPWFFDKLLYTGRANFGETSVCDEKAFYFPQGGTISWLRSPPERISVNALPPEMQEAISNGEKGYINAKNLLSGYTIWNASFITDLYLSDYYGLQDPLLSHLPAVHTDIWRVGHLYRLMPAGYVDSIRQGENLIEDPGLHEYYDKILLIIQGDLWDRERLQTIWKMNTGQYEYLLEHYLETLG